MGWWGVAFFMGCWLAALDSMTSAVREARISTNRRLEVSSYSALGGASPPGASAEPSDGASRRVSVGRLGGASRRVSTQEVPSSSSWTRNDPPAPGLWCNAKQYVQYKDSRQRTIVQLKHRCRQRAAQSTNRTMQIRYEQCSAVMRPGAVQTQYTPSGASAGLLGGASQRASTLEAAAIINTRRRRCLRGCSQQRGYGVVSAASRALGVTSRGPDSHSVAFQAGCAGAAA